MPRRSFRAALLLLAVLAVFGSVTAAAADPFFPDPRTSVVVTRLTVTDGKGWLVLQPRIGQDTTIGFEVSIPAGTGSWSGSPHVLAPELGIACVRKPGPDLHYLCGSDGTDPERGADPEQDPATLPSGGYQISIPVTRSGPATGLTRATTFWEVNPSYGAVSYASDTFPVVDAAHVRSNAEVRSLHTGSQPSFPGYDVGDIAVTMTVVPGERVHALDLQLPPADWRVVAYQLRSRVTCTLSEAEDAPLIHCAASNPGVDFPAGRYPFVVKVAVPAAEDDSAGQDAAVALTVNGNAPAVQDTFGWVSPFSY